VKFGLFLMPIHPPEKPWQQMISENTETIVLADRLGFDEAWIGEHHTLATEPIPAPDLFIAKLFGMTHKIRLGTGVVLLQFHDPVMLAHRIAVLDQLGKGRFNFGIGTGGQSSEFELFGIKQSDRHERAMEVMDIVLSMWDSQAKFRYRGKFFKIDGPDARPDLGIGLHMKPYQTPHPPIAVAAGSPFSSTAKYAGGQGWIVMSSGITHPSLLWTIWDAYQKGSAAACKSPDRTVWRVSRNIHVAKTMEQAQKEANEHGMRRCIEDYAIPQFKALMGSLSMFKASEEMPDEEISFDWLVKETFIVGDPEFVIKRIKELYTKVGGFGTLLLQLNDWYPAQIGQDSLELFMEEVVPSIRGLGE